MKIEKDNFSICDRGDSEEKIRVFPTKKKNLKSSSYESWRCSTTELQDTRGTKASKLIGLFTVNFQNISKKLPHAMSTKY